MIVRPLRRDDDQSVRDLFDATVALGRPVPFPLAGLDDYRALCLDWYLGPGREDAVVAEVDGAVVGYALVAVDGVAHARWTRRAGGAWAARGLGQVLAGRLDPASERFVRLRLRDGWVTLVGPPPPCPEHLHVNVAAGHRAGRTGRLLIAAAEERLALGGRDRYHGEVNAPVGRRMAALERHGARVVARMPNLTLSWLAGRPVERLRVVRRVPALGGAPRPTVPWA